MLFDVLAGILILSIGVACLVDLTAGARQALFVSQWKTTAANAAQSELEDIVAMGAAEAINSGRLIPEQNVEKVTANNLRVRIYSTWLEENLMEVKVTTTWQYASREGTVVLDTLLAGGQVQ